MNRSKRAPRLRFPEFTYNWQEKKLGDLLDYEQPIKYIVKSTEYDANNGTPVLTAGKTFILGYTVERYGIFKNELPVIIFDDFTTASHLVNFPFKVKSSAMKVLKSKPGVNTRVIYEILKRLKFAADDHKRYWISTFQDFLVNLPYIEEQEKIAGFLGAVDERIETLEKKIALSKKYKKGLMQKIFSQELRFKDKNGNDFSAWQEKIFDECLQSVATKSHQIQNSKFRLSGKYPVIDQGQSKIAGYSDDNSKLFTETPVIIFGDHTTFLKFIDFSFVVGADGTKILKTESNILKYFFYYLQQHKIEPEGYKRHFSALKLLKIKLPCLDEQKRIADFLTAIDEKIEAEERKLEQAKQFKKALLQQMFV